MLLKKVVVGCFLIAAITCNAAAQTNNIRVFVSFNAVQISPDNKFAQIVVCPGDNQYLDYLPDGTYQLFATPVDYVSKALYGNFAYMNNPVFLVNDSSLAVYFPSSFRENR